MSGLGTGKIRNLVLLSHQGAGKTSLAEAMLYLGGATDRLGKVEDGTTVCDFDPEEKARQVSIMPALAQMEWQGYKINLLDTPGYMDFAPEAELCVTVADAAVLVIDGVAGIEVQTDRVLKWAQARELPVVVFVNKLDKEHSSFESVVEALAEQLKLMPVPMTLPLGQEGEFEGFVDPLVGKAYVPEGKQVTERDVPAELADQVEAAREKLVEAAAAADEDLMLKYLEDEPLTEEELQQGLRSAIRAREFVPVLCGSATRVIGASALLEVVVKYLPSPLEAPAREGKNPKTEESETRSAAEGPLAASVFKTLSDPYAGRLSLFRVWSGSLSANSSVWNATKNEREKVGQLFFVQGGKQEGTPEVVAGDMGAVPKLAATGTGDTLCDPGHPIQIALTPPPEAFYSASLHAASRADEEKLTTALSRLAEEDFGFSWRRDPDTGELIASGLGQLHLEIAMSRLRRQFGVECKLGTPKIAYRETLRGRARVQGRHKKQTGGRGQFGDVWIRVEPLERGAGFEFVDEVVGGSVPRNYIPAVEKGIIEAMKTGVLAGYPMVDLRVTLDDGSSHPVDSSEIAFKLAAGIALRKAAQEASPVLLEPVVDLEVTTPEDVMGDIIGDLNGKRGRIQGVDPAGAMQTVHALVPLAELSNYGADLRSLAQGRATYTMKFSHYEEVPPHLTEQIVAAAKREKAGGEDE